MTETYTTGTWRPNAGQEDAFVAAWAEFAAWASGKPGVGMLHLGRDAQDPGRYVSFGEWESADAVRGWKSDPDFRENLARVLQYVDEFDNTELTTVVAAGRPHTITMA